MSHSVGEIVLFYVMIYFILVCGYVYYKCNDTYCAYRQLHPRSTLCCVCCDLVLTYFINIFNGYFTALVNHRITLMFIKQPWRVLIKKFKSIYHYAKHNKIVYTYCVFCIVFKLIFSNSKQPLPCKTGYFTYRHKVWYSTFSQIESTKATSMEKELKDIFSNRHNLSHTYTYTGLILGLHPASERRPYNVSPSVIGWAQTYNQPCIF